MPDNNVYRQCWDSPHAPGPEEGWQESDCYWFYDVKQGVGGFHRVGQRPNQASGQLTLFVFAKRGSRFVLNDSHHREPRMIGPANRTADGQHFDGHRVTNLGGGILRYEWEEEGASAGHLEFYESFYEPRNWSRDGRTDDFASTINPDGHLEVSGRLRGRIRIGDEEYQVDALAHRDRSWGKREQGLTSMHRYRMFSGTVGPELSFATFFLDTHEYVPTQAGFVVRNGVEEQVKGLRVLAKFDADGFSPVGATAIITLDTDEDIRIDCTAVQGFMTQMPAMGAAMSDSICTFEYAGKTGFLDLELVNNPQRGTYLPGPAEVSLLAVSPGLSLAADYAL